MNKTLDHATPTDRERPELKVFDEITDTKNWTRRFYIGESYGHECHDLEPTDWIPSVCAAQLAGISKQAISDRIKRGTLPHRNVQRKSWWTGEATGQHVVLVQMKDVQKKTEGRAPQGIKE